MLICYLSLRFKKKRLTGTQNTDELFIIRRMVEGDRQAFRYFFDQYYNDLCNFVNIYLKDQVLAEEVVQDIFVYFWENKHKIQIRSSVKAYLFGASKYKSLNVLRSQKNQASWFEPLADDAQFIGEMELEQFSGAEEFRQILNEAILHLPEKCRKIFLLGKEEEMSNREIAEQLGLSVKTVENQMTIALRKLRSYLGPYRHKIFALLLFSFFQ
jgi:RNA polymerase sigma-70 factor (ECF subfamily)